MQRLQSKRNPLKNGSTSLPRPQLNPWTSAQLRLLLYHEIPSWQQENEFLLSGYRPTAASTAFCLLSIFGWHNETINIHSHVFGSILFALLPWHFYYGIYVHILEASRVDLVLFTLYFLGVSVCFAFSAACHVLWNHSQKMAALGNRLDYVGIVLLMWTAGLPSIYYGFTCDPRSRDMHAMLTSLLALGCIVATLHPKFSMPRFRGYRALLYAGLGCSAVSFVSHGVFRYGYEAQKRRMALAWMGVMAILNLIGVAAYAARVPERWCPYRFDLVGASHQIFHVMVVLAGLAHYAGLAQALYEIRIVGIECAV